uniref:EF-hand domain-containing protein n=1 Tax=Heterorhabditis bacteriophora TaxID=37862 RepID=A0A1I7X6V1_HETBA
MSSIQDDILYAFHFYDTKGDNKITVSQKSAGSPIRSILVDGMRPQNTGTLRDCEIEFDGCVGVVPTKFMDELRISIEDFTPIYHNVRKEENTVSRLEQFQNLLANFDREGSGVVLISDLRFMLQNLGEKMLVQDIDSLLSSIDISDGKIHTAEFIRMILSL